MPNNTINSVQTLWIANLKSQTSLVALLANAAQIKEVEWQGPDFVYPGVRLSVEFTPGFRCLDKADLEITVFSEQKSSNEATTIASVIQQLYHERPFTQNGVQFPVVVVRKIRRPVRTIYSWEVTLEIHTQIA